MSDDLSPLRNSEDTASPVTLEPFVEEAAEVAVSGGGRKRLVLMFGILAIFGGAIFAAFALLSNQENTPGEGATSFMDALAAEDLIGITESLLPAERRVIAEPLLEWLDEVERLGILSEVDRNALQGLNLDFSDLVYKTEELADDLAWVSITGATSGSVRPEDLPFGDLVKRYLPEGFLEDFPSEVSEESDLDEDFGFALVKENGTWYVSLLHTVAEVARRDAGLEFKDQQLLNEPQGAASPTEALELFALSAAAFDVRGMLNVIDPDETAAFRRYTPLFLPDWDTSLADFRSEMTAAGVTFRVSEVTTESGGTGEDLVAWVTGVPKFEASIEVPGLVVLGVELEEDCFTLLLEGTFLELLDEESLVPGFDLSKLNGETCLDGSDLSVLAGTGNEQPSAFNTDDFDFFGELPVVKPIVDHFSAIELAEQPDLEFKIVEQDGRYFVSLLGTYNRWYLSAVMHLDEELLTVVGDDIQEIVEDPDAVLGRILPLLEDLDPTGGLLAGFTGLADPVVSTDSGKSDSTGYAVGADILGPYSDQPGVFIVWDYDVDFVVGLINDIYGPGIVIGTLSGAEMRAYFVASFGPEGDFGMSDEEFPSGIQITGIGVDTLVEIFDWAEIIDLYTAEELGIVTG